MEIDKIRKYTKNTVKYYFVVIQYALYTLYTVNCITAQLQ